MLCFFLGLFSETSKHVRNFLPGWGGGVLPIKVTGVPLGVKFVNWYLLGG